jgi:YegS/Rv2252/BmrU family lipid kinase
LGARSFVIVNPAAAAGGARRAWPRLRERLLASLGPFEHAFTGAQGHAVELAREAARDGVGLVVAVGGDGTLGEVATGLVSAVSGDGAAPPAVDPDARPTLGLVPLGTGRDFARTLGIAALDDALARLARGTTRRLDVGWVSHLTHDGRPAARAFVNVLSLGAGGEVVHTLTRTTKRLGGRLAFTLATARALVGHRDRRVSVSLDGSPDEAWDVTNLAVCNGQFFGGGMWVAPEARCDDGLLDLTLWSGFGLLDFATKRRALYDGRHVGYAGTSRRRARTLQADSAERVRLDADGESAGTLPARVELLPGALRLRA